MPHPIAIAFIHGIGRTKPGYSAGMQRALKRRFAACAGKEMPAVRGRRAGRDGRLDPCSQLVFEEVNWSAALQYRENSLWRRLRAADGMRYGKLRRFLVDFAADAIAYQPAVSERTAYDAIHREVAATLARLADRAGPRAPLCIIAHSLGTVIAISDPAYRAQSVAGLLLSGYLGLSLPVIGMGIALRQASVKTTLLGFAVLVSLMIVAAAPWLLRSRDGTEPAPVRATVRSPTVAH